MRTRYDYRSQYKHWTIQDIENHLPTLKGRMVENIGICSSNVSDCLRKISYLELRVKKALEKEQKEQKEKDLKEKAALLLELEGVILGKVMKSSYYQRIKEITPKQAKKIVERFLELRWAIDTIDIDDPSQVYGLSSKGVCLIGMPRPSGKKYTKWNLQEMKDLFFFNEAQASIPLALMQLSKKIQNITNGN